MATSNVRTGFFGSVTRFVPAIASTMAALTTVFSFLYSNGMISFGRRHSSVLRAGWITVTPFADTAYALGDTIHLAATVTDKNGAVILGAQPIWTSESPSIARVEPDGSVITKTPGVTTIIAAVDGRTARARVFVRQRVAVVRPARDSSVSVPEGERATLQVFAFDGRGHIVRGRAVRWSSGDTGIATVDTSGVVTGVALGQTLVHSVVDELTTAHAVTVFATPAAAEVVEGDSQHAPAGTAVPQQIVVRVLSRKGRPVEGATVRFRVADGMGAADPATATSDNQGRVRTRWTLGELPGVQQLLVTVDGADSTATAAAEADPVASNTRVLAIQERVSGSVGSAVGDPVGVRVTDGMGRLLAGVPVTWAVLDGGSVEGLTTRTDSAGEARAHWVLGERSGAQRLRAQVGSGRVVPPFTIIASALPGAPSALVVASGDRQAGRVGEALARPIVLRVTDSIGNPVGDAPLSLTLSGGSLAESPVRTDSLGRAILHWTMGHDIGSYTLTALITGRERAKPLVVAARAAPGAPETLTLDATIPKGKTRTFERMVMATVKDVFGNPIPDATVRLTTKPGTVKPASVVTDARGRASVTWRLSTKATEQTLTATVRGSEVRETLTVEPAKKP